jgi:hypothetical protein
VYRVYQIYQVYDARYEENVSSYIQGLFLLLLKVIFPVEYLIVIESYYTQKWQNLRFLVDSSAFLPQSGQHVFSWHFLTYVKLFEPGN